MQVLELHSFGNTLVFLSSALKLGDLQDIWGHVPVKVDVFLKRNLMEIMTYLRQSHCPLQGQTWRTSLHSVEPVQRSVSIEYMCQSF